MRLTKNESCNFTLDFKSQEVFDFLGRRQMRMPVTNFDPTHIPHLLHTHMKGKSRSPKRIPHQDSKSSCWKMLICRKESLWQNSALRSQTSLERREPRRQASRITSTTNEKSLARRRRQRLRASSRNSDTFPTPKRKRSPASKPTSSPSSSWITQQMGRPRPQRHGAGHAPRGLPDGRLHEQL